MSDYEPKTSGPSASPVVGMVVVGALFILIEGFLEIGIVGQATVYGLPIPSSIWAVPAFTIILAGLLFYFAWSYSNEPSWGLGVLFIVFGVLSFVLGAGFVVGGILIIVGGAVACFADWVQQQVYQRYGSVTTRTTNPSTSSRSVESGGVPPHDNPPPSQPWSSSEVIVYVHCPSCGELNRRGLTVCSACGKSIGS